MGIVPMKTGWLWVALVAAGSAGLAGRALGDGAAAAPSPAAPASIPGLASLGAPLPICPAPGTGAASFT